MNLVLVKVAELTNSWVFHFLECSMLNYSWVLGSCCHPLYYRGSATIKMSVGY